MKTYNVKIVERLVREVDVFARTEDEARKIAEAAYYNSDIVLHAGDFVDVNFTVKEKEE